MSGQLIVGVNPSNALQNCEVTAAGHLKMDIASSGGGALAANVDVTGNTIGLSTSALQTTGNTSLATLAGAVAGSEFQVDVVTSALPSGASTSANQATGNTSLATIAGDTTSLDAKVTSCNTGAVVISSNSDTTKATSTLQSAGNVSLATLAACENGGNALQVDITADAVGIANQTLQTAGNTTLTAISGKLPATLGQKAMSAALAVSIASDQSAISVTTAGANVSASSESASPGAGVTTNSTAADMNGYNYLAIFGTSNNTSDQFLTQVSNDNVTFYVAPIYYVSQNYSTGNFAMNISNPAFRYIRISQGNTTGSGKSLTIITSKK